MYGDILSSGLSSYHWSSSLNIIVHLKVCMQISGSAYMHLCLGHEVNLNCNFTCPFGFILILECCDSVPSHINSIFLFDWQCLYTASWWYKLNVVCRSKNLDQHHLQTPQFSNSWIKQLGSMGTSLRLGLGATIQLSLTALSYSVLQNFIVHFQHHIQTSLNSSLCTILIWFAAENMSALVQC